MSIPIGNCLERESRDPALWLEEVDVLVADDQMHGVARESLVDGARLEDARDRVGDQRAARREGHRQTTEKLHREAARPVIVGALDRASLVGGQLEGDVGDRRVVRDGSLA